MIAGLFDHLTSQHPGSRLLGFLNGPRGIINADYKKITAEEMASPQPSRCACRLRLAIRCPGAINRSTTAARDLRGLLLKGA